MPGGACVRRKGRGSEAEPEREDDPEEKEEEAVTPARMRPPEGLRAGRGPRKSAEPCEIDDRELIEGLWGDELGASTGEVEEGKEPKLPAVFDPPAPAPTDPDPDPDPEPPEPTTTLRGGNSDMCVTPCASTQLRVMPWPRARMGEITVPAGGS